MSQDFVVFDREEFFQFLGQYCLPPWEDKEGRWIGGDIDCAPIAERLLAWVAEHDYLVER